MISLVNNYGVGKNSLARRVFDLLNVFPSNPQLSFSPNVVPVVDISSLATQYFTKTFSPNVNAVTSYNLFTVPNGEAWLLNSMTLTLNTSNYSPYNYVWIDGRTGIFGATGGISATGYVWQNVNGTLVLPGSVIAMNLATVTTPGSDSVVTLKGARILGY